MFNVIVFHAFDMKTQPLGYEPSTVSQLTTDLIMAEREVHTMFVIMFNFLCLSFTTYNRGCFKCPCLFDF
jgi:hypothetical protein